MPSPPSTLDAVRQALQAGDSSAAERQCRQLLLAQPDSADAHYQLGVILATLGRTAEAAASYGAAVRYQPQHAEALTNLGVLLAQQGRLPEATDLLRRAVAARPTFAKAHHNLGVALAEQGKLPEAADSLRRALEHQPDYAEAHFNLANTLRDLGRRDEALASFQQALQHRPDYPDALNNLGLLLTERSRPAEAMILLQQALRLRPDFTEARNNLGLALADLGRFDEAVACYDEVLKKNPRSTDAHTNLGSAYKEQGRLEEALACYDQALRLKPDAASTHWNRALAWLQQGDFERGWAEYEWRWKRKNARPRPLPQPLWDGAPLEGRRILLWCEQGLGDAIQFVRYAPLVHEHGGRVLLECPPPLRQLFEGVAGVERLLVEGEELPPFDVHAPLMSLPHLCKTTLANVPATVPYLHAAAEATEHWRSLLPAGAFRVGVVWQGNPHHKWDRHRSFAVHALAPLAAVPGVQLVCLQKGPGLAALRADPPRLALTHPDGFGADASFADTAAIMKQLDLVVTTDTAPAHLAGALGVPVWVALAAISDWRWLRGRADTPWYPTMRLFRQRALGDWDTVFERMAAELAPLAAAGVAAWKTTSAAQERRGPQSANDKVMADLEQLAERVASYKRQGRRVVLTNGCFDILHRGHVALLEQARALGDVLVVAVNTDAGVQRLKGPGRPVNTLEDRLAVLAALGCVDHVVAFGEDTPVEVVRALKPDVFVKGGDYTRETLPEAPLVEELAIVVPLSWSASIALSPVRFPKDRRTGNLLSFEQTTCQSHPPGAVPNRSRTLVPRRRLRLPATRIRSPSAGRRLLQANTHLERQSAAHGRGHRMRLLAQSRGSKPTASGNLPPALQGQGRERRVAEACHRRLASSFWKRRCRRGRHGWRTAAVNAGGQEATANAAPAFPEADQGCPRRCHVRTVA